MSRYIRRQAALALLLAPAPFAATAAQTSRACWLVRPAEAAQLLARPDLADGQVMQDDHLTCDYLHAGFDVHVEDLPTPAPRRAALERAIEQGTAEAVSGIGDEAAFSPELQTKKWPSLVVLKGSRAVTVSTRPGTVPAAQVKPTLMKLATAALAKLVAPRTAETSRACWVIRPAEVATILGKPELGTGDAIHDQLDDCDYKGAGFELDILSFTRAPQRGEAFGAVIKQGKAEAVPGLGDEAALLREPGSNDQLLAVVMGRRILKIIMLQSARTPQEQVKPTLVKLGTTAVTRLR